jgi:putative transposase
MHHHDRRKTVRWPEMPIGSFVDLESSAAMEESRGRGEQEMRRMPDPTEAILAYPRKVDARLDPDFLREAVRVMSALLMDFEVKQQIGADRYERTEDRTTYRNGYRERDWQTRVGEIPLKIPKLREGSYFPSLLEPRRQAEQALLSVIQQAYIQGVSTRRVDALVKALGLTGIDKSAVSRISQQLDRTVRNFRERRLEGDYPYLWLDALYLKVRQNHRIVSQAVVIAIGVKDTGEREILGFDIGASEEQAFWLAFLRSLVERGLQGVQLVISDAHTGLKAAIGTFFQGASWQRCRVHCLRNLLAHVPQGDKAMVAAAVRTLFAQPQREAAGQQLHEVVKALGGRWPKAAKVLADAEDDILACMAFPPEHWTRLYSINPLERTNREIKRRTDIVGIFPDQDSVIRLVGSVLMEIDDEWQVERRYFSQDSMRKLKEPGETLSSSPGALQLGPIR